VIESTRILVVDDDESIRKSLMVVLELKGYLVDTAENGEEEIKKSNANYYRLALIDIHLPDMARAIVPAPNPQTKKIMKIVSLFILSSSSCLHLQGRQSTFLKKFSNLLLCQFLGEGVGPAAGQRELGDLHLLTVGCLELNRLNF
jgi:response regulator RpfG family c-di-GMP phosphodiesterase